MVGSGVSFLIFSSFVRKSPFLSIGRDSDRSPMPRRGRNQISTKITIKDSSWVHISYQFTMLRHAIRPTRLPGNVLRGLSSPLTRWVCSCQPNDEDHVIGFSRPREGEPVGSLKLLHQVVFVHTGHDDWPLAWAQGEPTAIRDFVDQANQEKKNVGQYVDCTRVSSMR